MAYYPQFAELLNKHLVKHERSPSWLASHIKVSVPTVTRWLNSDTRPGDAELVIRITNALKLKDWECDELLLASGYPRLKDLDVENQKTEPSNSSLVFAANESESTVHDQIAGSMTIDELRAEAQKRGIDRDAINRLLYMLIQHPEPDFEVRRSRTQMRVTITAISIALVGITLVLLVFLRPQVIQTLRNIIDPPPTSYPELEILPIPIPDISEDVQGITPESTSTLSPFDALSTAAQWLGGDTITETYTITDISELLVSSIGSSYEQRDDGFTYQVASISFIPNQGYHVIGVAIQSERNAVDVIICPQQSCKLRENSREFINYTVTDLSGEPLDEYRVTKEPSLVYIFFRDFISLGNSFDLEITMDVKNPDNAKPTRQLVKFDSLAH